MVNKLFKSMFALATVLGTALGFVACEQEEPVVDNPTVDLSTLQLNFTNEEGAETVDVIANAGWMVDEFDVDWITVTPMRGEGNGKITVSVPMNDTGAVREAVIKVYSIHAEMGKWDMKKLRIAQSADSQATVTEELLYGDNFREYDILPRDIVLRANYTDTADSGTDYLCSLCYAIDTDGVIYITDAVYSQEPMEQTERLVGAMLRSNDTRRAYIESNNGGRGFARALQRQLPEIKVEWFHQSDNKEARILSNSATVLHNIRMPHDWHLRWPEMYSHLTTYRRLFRSNRHDDAADALTGIVEREVSIPSPRPTCHSRFLR